MVKNKQNNKKYLIIIGILSLFIVGAYFLGSYFGEKKGINSFEEEGVIVNEGNQTFKKQYDNYYDVEYENNQGELVIKINNPCIRIEDYEGDSMKPYWDEEGLIILDTCFPREKLEIGDVIVFHKDFYVGKTQHRIIEIDYDDEWVRTKGDGNDYEDDLKGFNYIYGKTIGLLNVLEDKKVVREEVINETNKSFFKAGDLTIGRLIINQTCVCTSTGFLQFCNQNRTQLLTDTFIMQNDLKEEYCKDLL